MSVVTESATGKAGSMVNAWDVVARRTWIGSLVNHVEKTPDAVAVVDESGRSMTWRELADRSAALSGLLESRWSIQRGARVGVHTANHLENVVLIVALGALGAVAAPISDKLTPPEVTRQVAAIGLSLIVSDAQDVDGICDAPLASPVVALLDLMEETTSKRTTESELERWFESCRLAGPDDASTIICTSGSTAAPKPIVLSHGNVMFAIVSCQNYYGMGPLDTVLSFFPWCHSNGHINQMLASLALGARLAVADRFTASGFVDQVRRFDPTVAFLNSTHVKMVLAKLPVPHQPVRSRLRVVPTALDMEPEDVELFSRVFGAQLRKVYYQTELCAPVTVCDLLPTRTTFNTNPLGYVSLSHQIRLVDAEGLDVPVGTPGEITVRSHLRYGVAKGRLAPETLELIPNDPAQWWSTGDLAVAESDGFMYFAGRTSEMVKVAGHNVSIPEVVAVLSDADGVSEAWVIGVPDAMREERLVAFVVLNGEQVDVEGHCRTHLASYKVPSEFRWLDEIPRTELGKIDTALLRRLAASESEDS